MPGSLAHKIGWVIDPARATLYFHPWLLHTYIFKVEILWEYRENLLTCVWGLSAAEQLGDADKQGLGL